MRRDMCRAMLGLAIAVTGCDTVVLTVDSGPSTGTDAGESDASRAPDSATLDGGLTDSGGDAGAGLASCGDTLCGPRETCQACAVDCGACTASHPEPPRVFLDTDEIPVATRTVSVSASDDLQAAIDAATCGDHLVLDAGATWTGNFVLREKSCAGWVVIRSSSPLPARGDRASPTDASEMAQIVTPNTMPAIATDPRASRYRLIGLEITSSSPVLASTGRRLTYAIVSIGVAGTSIADMPSDITLDRLYVHGTPDLDTQRCIAINGRSTAVIDSHVSECHYVGFDAQAIHGFFGVGPFKIVNNYLEGSGENVMFGGGEAAATRADRRPADIEIRRNYFTKPWSWLLGHPSYAGTRWTVKNLFELKTAERVVIEENVFENNWVHAQTGIAILFQEVDGTDSRIRDISFRYNIIRNSPGGMTLCRRAFSPLPAEPCERLLVEHNLFVLSADPSQSDAGHRRGVNTVGDYDGLLLRHNTWFWTTATGYIHTYVNEGGNNVDISDNLIGAAMFGLTTDGASGTNALDNGLSSYTYENNLIWASAQTAAQMPPTTLLVPTATDVGFADFPGGDYALDPSSPYAGAGRDGRDIGADVALLRAATSGVLNGR